MKREIAIAVFISFAAAMALTVTAEWIAPEGAKIKTGTSNTILTGVTTNLSVLVPGGGTNTFVYTNGLLKAVN